ncbi:MAG TPA: restriction endonuclease [Ktedonobacteraceae bacterium]|nr:restriction endonuclease [Ktedonobacteraceae bacterium]
MPASIPPPANPDLRRELKQQLLSLSARSFEFFAGEFLVYVGLDAVSVTRYIGDGGIDALGDLIAGRFRIPIGIQVKRHRNNVQRPDIDRFIGALSGRFSEGMFMTTASYAPSALQKAATSIPRVLTLNGEQVVSIMVEHGLGVKPSSLNAQKLDIDPDYFATFESMRGLLISHVREAPQDYSTNTSASASNNSPDEQTIELRPEEDLISLNALGYALRVDPARVRRWVEMGTLQQDASQASGERVSYYFRRDRIEQIRRSLGLGNIPASSDEWKQEFLDFAKSRNLSKSYKPVMIKAFFKLVDREGKVKIDDLVTEFRSYYVQQANGGQPLEQSNSLMVHPTQVSDHAIKRLIITNPLERFLIKNFIEYFPEEGVLRIAPQLWQELRHYEVMDALKSADEQISYYLTRL